MDNYSYGTAVLPMVLALLSIDEATLAEWSGVDRQKLEDAAAGGGETPLTRHEWIRVLSCLSREGVTAINTPGVSLVVQFHPENATAGHTTGTEYFRRQLNEDAKGSFGVVAGLFSAADIIALRKLRANGALSLASVSTIDLDKVDA